MAEGTVSAASVVTTVADGAAWLLRQARAKVSMDREYTAGDVAAYVAELLDGRFSGPLSAKVSAEADGDMVMVVLRQHDTLFDRDSPVGQTFGIDVTRVVPVSGSEGGRSEPGAAEAVRPPGRDRKEVVVDYSVGLTVPEELVEQEDGEPLDRAVARAARQILLDQANQYCHDIVVDPLDPYSVTAQIECGYQPGGTRSEARLHQALDTIGRMLGQRCVRDDDPDEFHIELHSDKEALELLVREGRADMSDRDGRIRGYPR